MSIRVDTAPLIAGSVVVGDPGHGVLGSEVPSDGEHGPGFFFDALIFPDDNDKEVRGLATRVPTLGVLRTEENGAFVYDGETDYFEYQLYVDGEARGGAQRVDLLVGAIIPTLSAASFANRIPSVTLSY